MPTPTVSPSVSADPLALCAALCSVDVERLDADGIREVLRGWGALRAWGEALEAAAIAAGERLGVFVDDGAVEAAAWLREHTGISGAAAYRRAQTAQVLAGLPRFAAALAAGEISHDHAAAVARAAQSQAHRAVVADCEADLLADARRLAADRFAWVVRRVCDRADEEAGTSRLVRDHERRRVSCRVRGDGVGEVHGEYPADDRYALVAGTIRAVAEQLWRADHPDHRGPVATQRASWAQYQADALVEVCRRAAAAGPDARARAVPVVIAALDAGWLRHELSRVGVANPHDGEAVELFGAGSLPAEAARRLACDCALVPAVLDAASAPLDLGRERRLPDRHQRRALILRDRGCRFPGCTRPWEWCDAHHIVPWTRGGPTSLGNLVLLCSHHHHLVHDGGWTLTGTAAALEIRRPDRTRFWRSGPDDHPDPDDDPAGGPPPATRGAARLAPAAHQPRPAARPPGADPPRPARARTRRRPPPGRPATAPAADPAEPLARRQHRRR